MESLPEELRASLLPLLESVKKLSLEIRACDKRTQKLCETKYPETERLMGINGVGFVTALTLVLLVEDPAIPKVDGAAEAVAVKDPQHPRP